LDRSLSITTSEKIRKRSLTPLFFDSPPAITSAQLGLPSNYSGYVPNLFASDDLPLKNPLDMDTNTLKF
jgi:hypothetical protein